MAETPEKPTTKRCPTCKLTKPIEDFYSNGYCKPCGLKRARKPREPAKAAVKAAPVTQKKSRPRAPGDDPMVVNLFSIRLRDHAGEQHDLVLGYDVIKQLLTELKDCTR